MANNTQRRAVARVDDNSIRFFFFERTGDHFTVIEPLADYDFLSKRSDFLEGKPIQVTGVAYWNMSLEVLPPTVTQHLPAEWLHLPAKL